MRRHPPPLQPIERHVVGFYLHEKAKNSRGLWVGCGSVAFWTTAHPQPPRLVSDEDRAMNGQTNHQGLFYTEEQRNWVACVSCGSYVHLHAKRYRAIPRPDDIRVARKLARAMDLSETLTG